MSSRELTVLSAIKRSSLSRFLKSAGLTLAVIVLLAQPGHAVDNPLGLFKNKFITGDFASVGVRIRGTGDSSTNLSAPAEIRIPWCHQPGADPLKCVPKTVDGAETDIIGAYLYWSVLEKTAKPSGAKGFAHSPGVGLAPPNPNASGEGVLTYPVAFFGKPIGADHAAPCWSSGGSTGFSNGAPTIRTYRLDFLRYLEVDPATGQRVPVAKVQLPDSGSSGNGVPLTEGVSLVVLYRNYKLPYRGVVGVDGSFTINNETDSLNQTITGFYQAALRQADLKAKASLIAADGQSNFPEIVNLGTSPAFNDQLNGPDWDDKTYDVSSYLNAGASSFNVKVTHGSGSFDCTSWGAIWFSVTVQDSDLDGLLDVWEQSAGFTDIPSGKPINLTWRKGGVLKGADPCVRNLFVEVDWMQLTQSVGLVTPHSHIFSETALNMVGKAFNDAGGSLPATTQAVLPNCPGGIGAGIKAYFDVGDNYQNNEFVMPRSLAEGGDVLNEKSGATYCTSNTLFPQSCLFPNQAGVISWKKGVHHVQKAHVPSQLIKQYFSEYRENIFHWAFMAHSLAMKGPVIPGTNNPVQYQANSTSGRADLPGGDFVVSVGGWRFTKPEDAYRGSTTLEATTFLHELAHNLWGFHGGVELERDSTGKVTKGLNCKPNQQSVLNYTYHALGLMDANGAVTVDLSGQAMAAASQAENEAGLIEQIGIGTSAADTSLSRYRLRWYAKVSAVEALLRLPPGTITPAKAHCDGSPFAPGEISTVVRADRIGLPQDVLKRTNVDWDFDGLISVAPLAAALDLNFDGKPGAVNAIGQVTSDFNGVNDWQHIIEFRGLQQVGARRSVFGLSVGAEKADLLSPGVTENSSEADVSEADVSEADVSEADVSEADVSEADASEADVSEADVSEADVSQTDPDKLDVTAELAGAGNPTALSGEVSKSLKGIILRWEPGAAGTAVRYTIYRITVGSADPPVTFVLNGTPPATTFTDTTVKNETYVYYVLAGIDEDGNPSTIEVTTNPSNLIQIAYK